MEIHVYFMSVNKNNSFFVVVSQTTMTKISFTNKEVFWQFRFDVFIVVKLFI